MHMPKPHPRPCQLGFYEERSLPGALAYQAMGIVVSSNDFRGSPKTGDALRELTHKSVSMALVEAPTQQQADVAHGVLLGITSRALSVGSTGLPIAMEHLRGSIGTEVHQVLVWSDGVVARLIFQGNHRLIFIRSGQASLIQSNAESGVGHLEFELSPGDAIILVAHATHAQLPVGVVAAMAREESDPQALCQRAVAQAVQADKLNHHGALALYVAGT